MKIDSPIKYLLFDLGGTLMHARGDWQPVLTAADDALVHVLAENKIQLDAQLFRARLHEYYDQRDKNLMETTYHFVLRQLLVELNYSDVEENIIRKALDALYTVTQRNWQLVDGAYDIIQQLYSQRYRLGVLSNAGDDKDVQQLIAGFGINKYFDFVLTSAACFYRKPHPRSFEFALAHWNANPEETIMIGDTLEADIEGAQKMNMKTIWISQYAKYEPDDFLRIKPHLSLLRLNELLPALENVPLSGRT